MTFNSTFDGKPVELTLRFKKSFTINEQNADDKPYLDRMVNFVQVMFKKVLYEHKFKQIGRLPRFFLASDMRPIKQHNLEMWPGYISQVKSLTDGIFLNIDCCTKFISSTSVLDLINDK